MCIRDSYKALDDISRERKLTPEERLEQKKYAKLADSFTPLAKGMNSEYANQNAYDCIQIHGGSGFMMEYACQRIYRDARITLSLIHISRIPAVDTKQFYRVSFFNT